MRIHNLPRLLARAAIVPCIAVLAGCATNAQLAEHIVRANLSQEDAANQLLLLNVLRAKDRHPMHFTKISTVRPAVGMGNPTFTVPMPFGPDFTTQVYNLSAQFAIQQSVDTVVLDSQEFIRGITTPVAPGLMIYMLNQGWPQQLVLHLFVKSIEIYEEITENGKPKASMVERLDNSPTDQEEFARFQAAIDHLRFCEIGLKSALAARIPFGPPLAGSPLGNLQGIAALKAADLTLVPVDGAGKETTADAASGYQVVRDQKGVQLEMSDRLASRPTKCEGVPFRPRSSDPKAATAPQSFVSMIGSFQDDKDAPVSRSNKVRSLAAAGENKQYAILNLRSPEAMLYYLGEIARAQAAHPGIEGPYVRFGPKTEAPRAVLFRIHPGGVPQGAAPVSVAYRGTTYALAPSSADDRSMHTLSLVHQILMLQNKGTETPGTTNVRILQ